jgi:hypothetical protein
MISSSTARFKANAIAPIHVYGQERRHLGIAVNHDHLTAPSYWFFKAFVAVIMTPRLISLSSDRQAENLDL